MQRLAPPAKINPNTTLLMHDQSLTWELQGDNFLLRKNVVVGYSDLCYAGLRALLALFLSTRKKSKNYNLNDDRNCAAIISPQFDTTVYSHPQLPSYPVFLVNFPNVTFLIANVELGDECSVLLSYVLCQLFATQCVENIFIVAGIHSSVGNSLLHQCGHLPLYALTLSATMPKIPNMSVYPLSLSTPLNDSFLASLFHLMYLEQLPMTLLCVPSYKHKAGILTDHTAKVIEVLSSVVVSLFKVSDMSFSPEILRALTLTPQLKPRLSSPSADSPLYL